MAPADAPTEAPPRAAPALSPAGSLAATPPDALLRFCAETRFTGTLAFRGARGRGVLPMLNGAPEIPAGDSALEAALDELLALTAGTYTLTQLLPGLPGAIAEGDLQLRGTLERTTVAELLRYCEGAGLTGTLTLAHEGRACVARYQRGELASLTVDGAADADLREVFAWPSGSFEIDARSVFAAERTSMEPQDGFLATVEVALREIVSKSEGAAPREVSGGAPSMVRSSTLPFGLEGLAPSVTGAAPALPLPLPLPPRAPRAITLSPVVPPDSTVKIYFVDRGPRAKGPSPTQHAAAHLGSEAVPLDPVSQKLPALAPPAATPAPSAPEARATLPDAAGHSTTAPGASGAAPAPAGRFSRGLTALFAAVLFGSVLAAFFALVALMR